MQIKTKTYNLTPQEFRRIISVDYFKRMKFILIILIVIILVNAMLLTIDNSFSWGFFSTLFLFVYFLSIPLLVSPKKQSQLNFMNRYCEIDQDFFTVFYEDGTVVKLKFEHFIKVNKRSEYYFLYMSNNQFHYLPVAAFESEQDIHRFDLFLEGKQLIKLWR